MASLASHINVWETCLQLLHRRGYRLAVSLPDVDEDDEDDKNRGGGEDDASRGWTAEKDGFTFWADNPIELLGLTAVYEDVRPETDQPYWWSANTSREGSPLYDALLDEALTAQDGATPA